MRKPSNKRLTRQARYSRKKGNKRPNFPKNKFFKSLSKRQDLVGKKLQEDEGYAFLKAYRARGKKRKRKMRKAKQGRY